MKAIHKENITLYVDEEKTDVKIESLGAMADADKTVEEAYALGRTGTIFEQYSDAKKKEHKLRVYRQYDKAKFKKNVKKATKKIITEPRNASVKRKNGKFVVVKEKTGYTMNMDETFANFKKSVESCKSKAKLDVVKQKAKYTSKDMAQIKDVLGTYTTEYGGSPYGRKVNVANGASKINGSIVYPGETLSVYKTVSQFTKENGYALAGSYENGQTVQTYGGGICQVSTTLSNAVIRAELEVTERSGHSMIVGYVDPSADAAIAGEYKDFKFKNNTEAPIYIEGSASGSNVSFTIYGQETRAANRKVSFASETLSTTDPGVKFEASSDAVGTITQTQSAHVGKSARLWKVVTVDGVEQSREIFNKTTYKASPKIYAVGTSSANPEAVSAMKAAIASQNEATIRAAAAQWKNAVQQPAADTTTDMTQQPADSAQQGQTQNQTQQTTVPAQTAQ